jgi:hypothetical protein
MVRRNTETRGTIDTQALFILRRLAATNGLSVPFTIGKCNAHEMMGQA